ALAWCSTAVCRPGLYIDEVKDVYFYDSSNASPITIGRGIGGGPFVTAQAQPLYTLCLLYDSTRPVKSGATLPVKLQLCDAVGNNLSSPNITLHATALTQTSTTTTGSVQDSGNANPENDFRFDPTLAGGGYILDLSTRNLATGMYNMS